VGDYFADMIVDNKIVVEVKAVSKLESIHEVQLVNYLKATGINVGLLINFGQSVEVKRRIFGYDADTD
jgi:GxxExxY protein